MHLIFVIKERVSLKMRKKIYLAHSSKDKISYVNFVAYTLEKYIGRENIIFDEFYFNINSDIGKQIIEAVKETSIFIVFLSSNSVKSKWVKYEIEQALKYNVQNIIGINITRKNYIGYLKKIIGKDKEFHVINITNKNECAKILLNHFYILKS